MFEAGLLTIGDRSPRPRPSPPRDVHSYAKTDKVVVQRGRARSRASISTSASSPARPSSRSTGRIRRRAKLVLDTRDLAIDKRRGARRRAAQREPRAFTLDKRDPILGSALHIRLDAPAPRVRIRYRTSPDASGLQWLTPAQTAGKKHPFMFSQSESIHARSWVPLQDTPAVRFTYTAHVRAPKDAARGHERDQRRRSIALDGDFRFDDGPADSVLPARDRGRRHRGARDRAAQRGLRRAVASSTRPRTSSPTPRR